MKKQNTHRLKADLLLEDTQYIANIPHPGDLMMLAQAEHAIRAYPPRHQLHKAAVKRLDEITREMRPGQLAMGILAGEALRRALEVK